MEERSVGTVSTITPSVFTVRYTVAGALSARDTLLAQCNRTPKKAC